MNFKKIVSENLDNMMADIKNMKDTSQPDSTQISPTPTQPRPAAPASMYEIRLNGKVLVTAKNKQELFQKIQTIP